MTPKERIILFVLASMNFTHILDFIIMVPLSNYMMPYLKITPFQFSLLVASYSISAFFSGLLIAMFIDRFDRKRTLVLAYIGFLIGTIACGFTSSYGFLLAARVLAGLFGGIIGAQVLSIVADLFGYERRGRAMAVVMSAFAVAVILGVPLSLYFTNLFKFNWHIPFLIIGGVGIVIVPFILRFIPTMKDHIKPRVRTILPLESLTIVIKSPVQRSALLFSGLLMLGHFLIIPFINNYIEFNKGFSKNLILLIYLVGGIASLIAALFLGRVADRIGKLPVFLYSVFFSLFMVLIITRLPDIHYSLVLGFFSVWFMLGTGRMITAQAMISEVVKPEQRGSFMSINGSIQQLGQGVAALIAGAIVLTEPSGKILRYNYVGYLSVIVLLGSFFLARSLFRKLDKKSSIETGLLGEMPD